MVKAPFCFSSHGNKDERYVLTWQEGNRAQKGRNAFLNVDGTCTNSTHEREQSWSSIVPKGLTFKYCTWSFSILGTDIQILEVNMTKFPLLSAMEITPCCL